MRIAVTGASGFIGRHLVGRSIAEGYEVVALSRDPLRAEQRLPAKVRALPWSPHGSVLPDDALAGCQAVVHLAGESVAVRWNAARQAEMRASRLRGTRLLVQGLAKTDSRPSTLVCASAIGYYGSRGDEILTEASPPGAGFLAQLCPQWEKEAVAAEELAVRVVRLRIGIALGTGGGALARMLLPFKAGVGGRLGNGHQWMSWIHLDDLVSLFLFALNTPSLRGPVNATAPNPVTNREFTRDLAAVLRRPALFPVPAFALRIGLGEMSEVVLSSQRVLPAAAETAGFRFRFRHLRPALQDLLKP